MEGYVYILEVKDILLPVCKIGMTERNPWDRCAEINKSSTGDFLWEVSHFVYVNECHELELLVHRKLEPLRQRRREFFGIGPDDAYAAMQSILKSQEQIKIIKGEDEIEKNQNGKRDKGKERKFKKIDIEYANLLQLFSAQLGIKGEPFGQLNAPTFGISDGNKGVQWNLAVDLETGEIRIGVNLEGSENTGGWLIADFLQSNPNINALKAKVKNTDDIFITITRDAWQAAARINIKEKNIGGKIFPLSEMNESTWKMIIKDALGCLDEERNYKGRKKEQPVTLVSDGRILKRDISPHLSIFKYLELGNDIEKKMEEAFSDLKPVYKWVMNNCK